MSGPAQTLRITVVQGYHLPVPPVLGGAVEKVWDVLIREFARRGHQVTHIGCRHPQLADDELVDGVHYLRLRAAKRPASSLLHLQRDLTYSWRARRRLPAADILVTNTFWLPILVRSPAHGRLYVHAARHPRGQFKYYRHAARVQGPSQTVIEAIAAQEPALAPRLVAIPNPLPWAIPATVPPPAARARTVLYAGRIHPEKGIELLAGAFARFVRAGHADWKLIVMGPSAADGGGGGDRYLLGLRERFADLAGSIEWRPPVYDAAALQAAYTAAPLFAYPSLAEQGETFGLAPLEAMSCGAVPLVTNLPCFREFMVSGSNGAIIDHRGTGAEERLAAALASFADDPELLAACSLGARQTAQAFTVAKVADRFLDDFNTLVQEAQ